MKHVEVGMFRLPGLTFSREEITPEVLEEMQAWAEAEGVGMSMTETLWSFKKEAHRDWFVLRWSDSLVKPKAEDV
jgi:L-rhamnose isomerase